jgi:hypothetical protein
MGWVCGVYQGGNRGDTREGLSSLGVELSVHQGETRKIPARPRQAGSETSLHRVHYGRCHNRNVAACCHGSIYEALRYDDIYW